MTTTVIITGHGHYGTGLGSSLELLAGHNEGVEFIDFLEEDTDIALKEKITNAVMKNTNSQVLFVCDLLGGTPFKVCAEIANSNENMEVVAGCNIGAVLEAVLLKDTMPIGSLADSIIKSSKKATVKFQKITSMKVNSNLEMDDGI